MGISSISNSTFSLPMSDNVYVQGAVALSAVTVLALAVLQCARKPSVKKPRIPDQSNQIVPTPVVQDIAVDKWQELENGDKVQLVKRGPDLKYICLRKSDGKTLTYNAVLDAYMYEEYAKGMPDEEWELIFKLASEIRKEVNNGAPTSQIVNWLRHIPIDKRISFFRDFYILKLEHCPNNTAAINFDFRTFKSKFGDVKINRHNWALTVVCRASFRRVGMGNLGHSVLVYEGVEGGEPFIRCIEVTKESKSNEKAKIAHHRDINFDYNRYTSKSQTWQMLSLKVNKMLNSVDRDIEQQNKGKPHFYSEAGGDTIPQMLLFIGKALGSFISLCEFPRPIINCHTYIMKKLRIVGIEGLDKYVYMTIGAIPTLTVPLLKV